MIKITTRWGKSMYNQIKEYAKDKEVSFMAALREIVEDFFRRRNGTNWLP